MKPFKFIFFFLITILLFIGCGSDRAGSSNKLNGVLGIVDKDSDGDGLSDETERNVHGTNPDNNDTDGDGLNDGDEINTYGSNPNNVDSDNDGLQDSVEAHTHETNVTNPDSDGDCLLDGFEVLNYLTNPNSSDSDNDKVPDGIEVYSYVQNDLNVSCLTTPETFSGGHNNSPARDGVPTAAQDVINALDPTNDSDGDGQANSYENNCTDGDPMDVNKNCPYIFDTEVGRILTEHGYAYVPGGFDVDGDGKNEGGFWISRYQARSSGVIIPSETVISDVGNINQYLSKNFSVVNRNLDVLSYSEAALLETGVVAGNELIFDEQSVAGKSRISTFTPYLAHVCLQRYKLRDSNGTALDINITMPNHKQYVQVKMLLNADLVTPNTNGLVGDGRHIRNGILGTDPNVSLKDYNLIIDEFGEGLNEYVLNLVQLRNTSGLNSSSDTFDYDNDVPTWWSTDKAKFTELDRGANATQDLGHGIGVNNDPYGVIVRGGTTLDVSEGASGARSDSFGQTNGISFRAATGYLY